MFKTVLGEDIRCLNSAIVDLFKSETDLINFTYSLMEKEIAPKKGFYVVSVEDKMKTSKKDIKLGKSLIEVVGFISSEEGAEASKVLKKLQDERESRVLQDKKSIDTFVSTLRNYFNRIIVTNGKDEPEKDLYSVMKIIIYKEILKYEEEAKKFSV
jgi:hypothetical protein